jgi:hypothetical protein
MVIPGVIVRPDEIVSFDTCYICRFLGMLVGYAILAASALLLGQHALDHVKELLAENLLLVVDLAGKLVTSEAVIYVLFDSTFKYGAGMPHCCSELLQLFRSPRIGTRYTATDGAQSSSWKSTDLTS